MASTTVSLLPLFLGSLGVTVDGTIIVGGLGVSVTDSISASVSNEITVTKQAYIAVPVDVGKIEVSIYKDISVGLEGC